MATSNQIEIFKEVIKTQKNRSVATMEKVTTKNPEETIKNLQKKGVNRFEVVNKDEGVKIQYSKSLGGKNYEKKVVKL